MTVRHILDAKGREVATIAPEASLSQAVAELCNRGIGALVVLDGEGAIAGILSERDVVRCIGAKGPDCLAMPVSSVMTRKVATCTEESTVDQVMELMTSGRFRHMPVAEGGRLVGLVSIGDVVKKRIDDAVGEAAAMREYIAG